MFISFWQLGQTFLLCSHAKVWKHFCTYCVFFFFSRSKIRMRCLMQLWPNWWIWRRRIWMTNSLYVCANYLSTSHLWWIGKLSWISVFFSCVGFTIRVKLGNCVCVCVWVYVRFVNFVFYLLPKLHGVLKTYCLECVLSRADVIPDIFLHLKTKGFTQMMAHRFVHVSMSR